MLGITLWYSHFISQKSISFIIYFILAIITPYIRMLDSDWVSVKGKNGKYDCYIKCTTDNVLQILLQGEG
jgi:hypothetical protein